MALDKAPSPNPKETGGSIEAQKEAYKKSYIFLKQGLDDLQGMVLMNKKIENSPISDADAESKASREKGRKWAIETFEQIRTKAKTNPGILTEYVSLIEETKNQMKELPEPKLITAEILAKQTPTVLMKRLEELTALGIGFVTSEGAMPKETEELPKREVKQWRANAIKNTVARRMDKMLGIQLIGKTSKGEDKFSDTGIVAKSVGQMERLIAYDLSKISADGEAQALALNDWGDWEVKYNGITFMVKRTGRSATIPDGYNVTIKEVDKNDRDYRETIAKNNAISPLFKDIQSSEPAVRPDERVAGTQEKKPNTPAANTK
jgi:hypothetical protein